MLLLGDNLGVVPACCRSRARSFRFIVQLRNMSSLCFIMDLQISFRWIPSELNSSDLASRVYEEGPVKFDVLEHLDSIHKCKSVRTHMFHMFQMETTLVIHRRFYGQNRTQ